MSDSVVLKLEKREATGKKVAKLREQGIIPSVIYNDKGEATLTQSLQSETLKVVQSVGRHTPVELMIGDKKTLAIIKYYDVDPVKHQLRHIEFVAIRRDEVIVTEVPIILDGLGESPAEKAGLIVMQAINQISVKAKPADLPNELTVSVVSLTTTDDKLTIGDIKLPAGVEFADVDQDRELVVANVYEASALEAANEATGGDAEADAEVPSENGEEESEKADEKTDDSEKSQPEK